MYVDFSKTFGGVTHSKLLDDLRHQWLPTTLDWKLSE